MKKRTLQFLIAAGLLFSGIGASAQCTGGTNYLTATLTNTTATYIQIAGCIFAGERHTLTVNNIAATYTFNSTGGNGNYLTVYDASNNIIAHGNAPLINVVFPSTGTYYLQVNTNSSCGTESACRVTTWKSEIQIPCSGQPSTGNIVASPTLVCPGNSSAISLLGSSFGTGMEYQWYESTVSNLGPFVPINTATNSSYSTPTSLSGTAYYQVVMTCTNSSMSSTSAVVQIDVAGVTIDTVPYFESFEGITMDNQLPNCSWDASNLPIINQTYKQSNTYNRIPHSGDKFASFRYGTNAAGDYFYSNGIHLEAGVTYSAGLWFINDGLTGWSEISLHYNTSQSSTGLTTIAEKTGALFYNTYQSLSDTFSVPATGVYYLAVRAIGNSSPWYLTWDDLFVTIPCEYNKPAMTLSTNSLVVCRGSQVNLTAAGADSYSWNTGATSAQMMDTPVNSTVYSVVGTHQLSGCTTTLNAVVVVNESPSIFIVADKLKVCEGKPLTLVAYGADSYTWSTNQVSNNITINPTQDAIVSVMGSNTLGCTALANHTIDVQSGPSIQVSVSPTLICTGESATLSVSSQDAVSFQWVAYPTNMMFFGQELEVSPNSSTIYSVTATNSDNCPTVGNAALVVDACLGISEHNNLSVKVFPNPNNGLFNIMVPAKVDVKVTDVTGREVATASGTDNVQVNISHLANGVYYLTIEGETGSTVTKIVKE